MTRDFAPASELANDPALVAVERCGMVEGVHHGRVAVTAADGSLLTELGAVEAPMYPRSAVKPLQAIAMLRNGLDLDGELLALAAASHDGEPFHVDGVRQILEGCGLTEEDLQNPAEFPLSDRARVDWIREHGDPAPVAMNCSGKHAAMLRTCVRSKWDRASYLAPEHPLQTAVFDAIAEFAGEDITHVAVDGCGAPLVAISLAGLARAFGRIAAAEDGPARQIADAYRAHPTWASGTRRGEAKLHAAVPGLVCKGGAEAVYAAGLPDGRGIAVKIDDGASRAHQLIVAQILVEMGYEHPNVTGRTTKNVLGHGKPVGTISSLVDSFL
ncbi:asparaginase [Propioniferax innocua]|uniref:Asparaginase n=1 Tax=Propioniferax innocua TaxID=1753 RepID=A0A542ZCP5_9ACTN|nr:asparaginase [Propioniferax innocua]TQL58067.1 asparaginase [Propioniferax innocua]